MYIFFLPLLKINKIMLARSFRILTRKVTSKNLFKTQRRMFSDEDDKTNLKEIKIPEIKKEELK